MLEIIFFIVAVISILLLYKENIQLKSKYEQLEEHYHKLEKKHEITEHTQHNLITVNAKIHEELKKLNNIQHENDNLKYILKEHNIKY